MNNRTKNKSGGTSCQGDRDSCKSGCGTGQEMRQEHDCRMVYLLRLLSYCVHRYLQRLKEEAIFI